jgi:hypothetical protein
MTGPRPLDTGHAAPPRIRLAHADDGDLAGAAIAPGLGAWFINLR